jgi:hypothetical protein
MKWKLEDVVDALGERDYPALNGEYELALALFDFDSMCGVGIDADGRRVLVLPGQEKSTSFNTQNAIFDPWSSVTWVDGTQTLPKVSTLRCEANFRNKGVCEVVAAIFIGLMDIQLKYGSSGSAIWEMKLLFENGFKSDVSEETIVGLFGELVTINSVVNPSKLIDLWHSNALDHFDFSSDKHRLEVKTSRNNMRSHRFSSNQIDENLDSKTTVVSIVLKTVEQGATLSDLIESISAKVDSSRSAKLLNTVMATLGVPPQLLNSIQIDIVTTMESMKLISARNIPRPIKTPGVLSMNWTANLDLQLESISNLELLLEDF